jgi:hypothetical protein
MVECCNILCPNGSWFHWSCVDPVITTHSDDDWFCCAACAQSEGYVYCFCRRKLTGEEACDEMVQCHLADNCKRHEWYHLVCLGKSANDLPGKHFIIFLLTVSELSNIYGASRPCDIYIVHMRLLGEQL